MINFLSKWRATTELLLLTFVYARQARCWVFFRNSSGMFTHHWFCFSQNSNKKLKNIQFWGWKCLLDEMGHRRMTRLVWVNNNSNNHTTVTIVVSRKGSQNGKSSGEWATAENYIKFSLLTAKNSSLTLEKLTCTAEYWKNVMGLLFLMFSSLALVSFCPLNASECISQLRNVWLIGSNVD